MNEVIGSLLVKSNRQKPNSYFRNSVFAIKLVNYISRPPFESVGLVVQLQTGKLRFKSSPLYHGKDLRSKNKTNQVRRTWREIQQRHSMVAVEKTTFLLWLQVFGRSCKTSTVYAYLHFDTIDLKVGGETRFFKSLEIPPNLFLNSR